MKPLVQGYMGYYVNGKLVHKPKRRSGTNKEEEHEHVKRNREYQEKLTFRRSTKDKQQQHVSTSKLTRLKNASKIGNLSEALVAINSMLDESIIKSAMKASTSAIHGKPQTAVSFSKLVRLIYTPDADERTALYYAAHTGHVLLVQFYLSLYVISRSMMNVNKLKIQSMEFGSYAHTYQEWFDELGYMPGTRFQKTDFDLCLLNALHEGVKNMLSKTKLTLLQIVDVVNKAMSGDAISIKQYTSSAKFGDILSSAAKVLIHISADYVRELFVKKTVLGGHIKRKKIKPQLNMMDDLGIIYDELEYENDNFDSDCDDDNYEYGSKVMSDSETPKGLEDCKTDNYDCDGESAVNVSISKTTLDIDYVDLGDWNSVRSEYDCKESIQSDWDLVSDVGSVKSMNTVSFAGNDDMIVKTYRDAILKKSSEVESNLAKHYKESEVKIDDENINFKERRCDVMKYTGNEYENESLFFFRDGVKGMRGGRKKLMFKGNSRRPKNCNEFDKPKDDNRDMKKYCKEIEQTMNSSNHLFLGGVTR